MANYNSEFTGTHNDEYDSRITALQSQIESLQSQLNTISNRFNNYLPLTGGTLTGPLTVAQQLTVTPENTTSEGGQIVLKKTGTTGTTDAYLDWYNGYFRIHDGSREVFTMNDICKPGDSLTFSVSTVNGLLTSSNQSLYLLFPINKIIRANSVSCTQLLANIRCGNAYLGSSAYVSGGTNFAPYVQSCLITQVGVLVFLSKNASWGGANNSAVAAEVHAVTFNFG